MTQLTFKVEYPHIKEWNLRYLAYCRANHNVPEAQWLIDKEKYPGGKMTGYILWNRLHWALFFQSLGLEKQPQVISQDMHKQYDEWLLKYYPK
jgi:hypothetical protein